MLRSTSRLMSKIFSSKTIFGATIQISSRNISLRPLANRRFEKLGAKGELSTTRRFFSSITILDEHSRLNINQLERYVEDIRKSTIPLFKESGKLAIYAENIAVYIEYLILLKKGLPNVPDSDSLLKMFGNTQSNFEAEVLYHPAQKEAIEYIRGAIRICLHELEQIISRNFAMKKQIPFSHRKIFITDEKWASFSPEIRKELSEAIFNEIDHDDNHGGVVAGKYEHLNQLVRKGYLNFEKYALMPSHSRTDLLNLLWHSSVYDITGGTWALKKNLFSIEEFLSFPKGCQNELFSILKEPVKDIHTHVDLTEAQKVEMIKLKLKKFKKSDLTQKWNQGYVPDIQDGRIISQEELDKINRQVGDSLSAKIKWEFDPYRSLYFFRVTKNNKGIEIDKSNQKPIKETADMVVFSLNKNKGK